MRFGAIARLLQRTTTRTLDGSSMTTARTKSEKRVAVSYLDGTEWEVWHLRFNRGAKRAKPVKFFAGREWWTPKAACPFGGTHWDFASERAAHDFFRAQRRCTIDL